MRRFFLIVSAAAGLGFAAAPVMAESPKAPAQSGASTQGAQGGGCAGEYPMPKQAKPTA